MRISADRELAAGWSINKNNAFSILSSLALARSPHMHAVVAQDFFKLLLAFVYPIHALLSSLSDAPQLTSMSINPLSLGPGRRKTTWQPHHTPCHSHKHSIAHIVSTLRNQLQQTTFLLRFAPALRVFVFDFAAQGNGTLQERLWPSAYRRW